LLVKVILFTKIFR